MEGRRKVSLCEGPQRTLRSPVSLGRLAEGRRGDDKASRVTGTAVAVGWGSGARSEHEARGADSQPASTAC